YVGLVTGACLSSWGNSVTLIDIDSGRVEALKAGLCPIYEPRLQELLSCDHITPTCSLEQAAGGDVVFICVGAGTNPRDCSVDLSAVEQVAVGLERVVRGGQTVVVKSTVPPGTSEDVILRHLERNGKHAGRDFELCMNPEFLSEGRAVEDFMAPDRIVIGERVRGSGDRLVELYRPSRAPVIRVDLKTAEMIKYASNAFLAAKISLVNELGNICKSLGIDMYRVAEAMAYDDRIGSKFLNSGAGFGGSCFPKDLRALISIARQSGYVPGLLKAVEEVNQAQPLRLVQLLKRHVPDLRGKTIGVLGLAFKPGTDDVRESVAQKVVAQLLLEGARVVAYDPQAGANFRRLFPQVTYAGPEEVLQGDAIVILTEWPEFGELDYRGRIVIDGRKVPKARDEARIYEGLCW
ncbi:MAG: UDP-glucose/GDP-mannose dehydrogenase family protein, partial [Chloroflexi bacterium]|nr:UDP-glucose/GDP-mannose dehydrogenase family protein [Chloroflexota bacterium]